MFRACGRHVKVGARQKFKRKRKGKKKEKKEKKRKDEKRDGEKRKRKTDRRHWMKGERDERSVARVAPRDDCNALRRPFSRRRFGPSFLIPGDRPFILTAGSQARVLARARARANGN